jgi:hypothetical protein
MMCAGAGIDNSITTDNNMLYVIELVRVNHKYINIIHLGW